MTKRTKAKDDEILVLTVLAIVFTGVLVWMDFKYSSIAEMALGVQWLCWGGQIVLAATWVLVFGNWEDPNFDKWRKVAFGLSCVLMLWVGIHHATSVEDKQVIIDSKENAAKP